VIHKIVVYKKSKKINPLNFKKMKTKKILFVDDDKDFVSTQSVLISHLGYEVFTANSSMQGFQMAKDILPDLIILDVNMETKYAGFELNKKIRKETLMSKVPIIMLTGIETFPISDQVLEMYNDIFEKENPDHKKVFKIGDNTNDISVQYVDDNAKQFYLPLDSFVPKGVTLDLLSSEIKRFIE